MKSMKSALYPLNKTPYTHKNGLTFVVYYKGRIRTLQDGIGKLGLGTLASAEKAYNLKREK